MRAHPCKGIGNGTGRVSGTRNTADKEILVPRNAAFICEGNIVMGPRAVTMKRKAHLEMPNRQPLKRIATTKKSQRDNSFEAVARRLGCDPDLKKFDAQLRKIAKAKPKAKSG